MQQSNSVLDSLEPFSAEPVCPKCTRKKVRVTYCFAAGPLQWGRKCAPMLIGHEHLHCRCGVCGYAWTTRCADFKVPAAEPAPPEPSDPAQVKGTLEQLLQQALVDGHADPCRGGCDE